jgi:hypothetical protein
MTGEEPPPGPGIDRKMLEFLVCPVSHGPLDYDRQRQELVSRRAGLAYPIRGGVPIMLPGEARKVAKGRSSAAAD